MTNDDILVAVNEISGKLERLASDLGFAPPTPEQTVILGGLYSCGAILELVQSILERPDFPVLVVKIVEGGEGGEDEGQAS